ncbi:MAG: DUF4037 domain-containing protein [Clostridiales bacterium]|nr:DUF4037 domain-containing protein [Clostridiales bacterium]
MYFNDLIEQMKTSEAVEGIMLGGSRATDTHDKDSDYDVYVYLNKSIDESVRKSIIDPYVCYMEYSNKFWELEDDGILKDGVDIEFIYRTIEETDQLLDGIVLKHQAWNGYTTCFWDNLLHSKILYDKSGKLKDLVTKYDIPYPKALKENIIVKNFKLLSDQMPSFYYQLEKAVKRNDLISMNHRLTELLGGYFDILFAMNEILHPGEKRLKEKTLALTELPIGYERHIEEVFHTLYTSPNACLQIIDEMIKNLYDLLKTDYEITLNSYKNQR